MKLEINESERVFANAVFGLTFANPFRPERIEFERQALGERFVESEKEWNIRFSDNAKLHGISLIIDDLKQLLEKVRAQLEATDSGAKLTRSEHRLYTALVQFYIYHKYRPNFREFIETSFKNKESSQTVSFWGEFKNDISYYLSLDPVEAQQAIKPEHLFALAFQLYRAFFNIYRFIIGVSKPVVELRGRVWESIFTHDMRRYQYSLYRHMGDVTTLITGPSGTGKELVARAIALARYIPFNEKKRSFQANFIESFYPLNLSALSPTLLESELFGHKRGAFTGAVEDRKGWLESCGTNGTVFLDEIGDLDPTIQVKLLRVLQTREFQRLGETKTIEFKGKVIAATNIDLHEQIKSKQFREDLFYRLCSDSVATPALRERLRDTQEELEILVTFIAQRFIDEAETKNFAKETCLWIKRNLDLNYEWPGNVRELEQCVRNILIRGTYDAPTIQSGAYTQNTFFEKISSGEITSEELLTEYVAMTYDRLQSYEETGRRLGLDRRTVKKYVDLAYKE